MMPETLIIPHYSLPAKNQSIALFCWHLEVGTKLMNGWRMNKGIEENVFPPKINDICIKNEETIQSVPIRSVPFT